MLSKLKTYYLENRIVLWAITGLLVTYLIYLSNATANVPFMDYWKYIELYADKVFSGGITFSDLWGACTDIHRAPILMLLFFTNMACFGLNVQIEIYLGALVIAVTSIYVYSIFVNTSPMLPQEYKNYRNMMYIFIAIAFFNYNQWEITTLEFSLAAMLRLLVFFVVFRSIDKLLFETDGQNKLILEKCILIFITICLFASGYFPALIGAITITIIINFILSYTEQKHRIRSYVFIFLTMILGSWVYLLGLMGGIAKDYPFVPFVKDIFNGTLLKGFQILLSSSFTQVLPFNKPYAGIVLLLIYIFVIFMFFKKRLYKQTFLPIILIFYSIIVMCEIFYGRKSIFGLEELVASRYVIDTNLGIIGTLWILIDLFIESWFKQSAFKKKITSIMIIFLILFITTGLILSCVTEVSNAKSRRQHSETIINVMLNKISVSEEELGELNYSKESKVFKNAVMFMKKYKLGVFETDHPNDNDVKGSLNIFNNNRKISNVINCNDNNWVNGIAKSWGSAFLVYNSSAARKQLAIGKTVIFCDGTKREIIKMEEKANLIIIFLDGTPLDGTKIGYPNQFNIGPYENPKILECNDNNWVNGIAKSWGSAFLVYNSSATRQKLAIGKTITFCDGTKRKITKVEEKGNIIVVFVEGAPLDGKKIGFPKQFSISS